jgi:hypothetical protein
MLAQSTQNLFGGLNPSVIDPALANPRQKRKIIRQLKIDAAPNGNGLEGALPPGPLLSSDTVRLSTTTVQVFFLGTNRT